MFETLRSRLWLTYAFLAAVVLCVVGSGLLVYMLRNPLVDRQDYLNLERISATVARRAEAREGLQSRAEEYVRRIDEITNVRVLILLPDKTVLADSRRGVAPDFGPLALGLIRLQRGVTRDQAGNPWLYVASSLDNRNTLVVATPRRGVLSLLIAQRFRDLLRDDILPPFLGAGCVALILALILAFGMARWVSAPLQRIVQGARQITEGKYHPIQPEGPDEVQKLALAFNEMNDRVQYSQQSQRDFVANVSHELKTPLTSIQGFAQAIMDGTVSAPDELQQSARVIFTEADRMHRLVLDLLDLARFDSGTASLEHAPVDIAQLTTNAIDRFEPQARQAQITLQKQTEDLPLLMGDGDRLAQVINNLLDNAIKYTPPGGMVSVTARQLDEQAVIVVSDTGPGIPADASLRIFERFYQTDKSRRGGSGRGVGLGLAIAREIVLAHGGSIAVENNIPQGCQFVVKIPFAQADDSALKRRGKRHA